MECWITVDVTVLPVREHPPDCSPVSKLATKLAKLVLRTLPAYPGPDYRPFDQITAEVGLRLARLAYDDERESGCGFLKYFEGEVNVSGGIILDLGCGFGGRTIAYQQVTGNTCVGIDRLESIHGRSAVCSIDGFNQRFFCDGCWRVTSIHKRQL